MVDYPDEIEENNKNNKPKDYIITKEKLNVAQYQYDINHNPLIRENSLY